VIINLGYYRHYYPCSVDFVLIFNNTMTKRSPIHPKLKKTLSSLELDVEEEITRYENQKPINSPKNEFFGKNTQITTKYSPDSQDIEIYHYYVTTQVVDHPVTDNLNVFKRPLGIASIVITILSSSLLGLNLIKPVEIKSTKTNPPSTLEIVKGLNQAKEESELNLQTLTTIKNNQGQSFTPHQSQPISNINNQTQSQLVNKLLPSR